MASFQQYVMQWFHYKVSEREFNSFRFAYKGQSPCHQRIQKRRQAVSCRAKPGGVWFLFFQSGRYSCRRPHKPDKKPKAPVNAANTDPAPHADCSVAASPISTRPTNYAQCPIDCSFVDFILSPWLICEAFRLDRSFRMSVIKITQGNIRGPEADNQQLLEFGQFFECRLSVISICSRPSFTHHVRRSLLS